MSRTELGTDLVVLACAVSAGIHAALAPGHLGAGTAPGLGFAAAAVALALLAAALTRRPASTLALAGAAIVFAALLGGYALAATTGVPLLHPQPEPVDGLGLTSKAIETVGLLAASSRLRRRAAPSGDDEGPLTSRPPRPIPVALTTLIALFSALTALAVSSGHDAHAHGTTSYEIPRPAGDEDDR